MNCPFCESPVAPPCYCPNCGLGLRDDHGVLAAVHARITPGDVVVSRDMRRDPPPGLFVRSGKVNDRGDALAEVDGGLRFTMTEGSMTFPAEIARLRDSCVRSWMTAWDDGLMLGVVMRREALGAISLGYAVEVDPARRSVRLTRFVVSPASYGVTGVATLVDWQESPHIAPLGAVNLVEMRAQGATLEAWVNDNHLATAHDPYLGIGSPGMYVETLRKTGRPLAAVLHGFEVRTVAA